MTRPGPAAPRGRSEWAPRCAVLSTVALLAALVLSGPGRSLFAFLWASLAVAAMALEWTARRRARPRKPAS